MLQGIIANKQLFLAYLMLICIRKKTSYMCILQYRYIIIQNTNADYIKWKTGDLSVFSFSGTNE